MSHLYPPPLKSCTLWYLIEPIDQSAASWLSTHHYPSQVTLRKQNQTSLTSRFQIKARGEVSRLSNTCWPDILSTGICAPWALVFCLRCWCGVRCTDHPDRKQCYMGGWIKGTPVFQLSLWLLAIWSHANLKRAAANIRKKNQSSRSESLNLILLLFLFFAALWGACSWHTGESHQWNSNFCTLKAIISPLPCLFSFMFLDVGSVKHVQPCAFISMCFWF